MPATLKLTREDTVGFEIRKGRCSSHNRPFDEVVYVRCHGATVWPRWLFSFVRPDLAIALKQEQAGLRRRAARRAARGTR